MPIVEKAGHVRGHDEVGQHEPLAGAGKVLACHWRSSQSPTGPSGDEHRPVVAGHELSRLLRGRFGTRG
jgi:hypothetical protein